MTSRLGRDVWGSTDGALRQRPAGNHTQRAGDMPNNCGAVQGGIEFGLSKILARQRYGTRELDVFE
jgi:hypothetical protein